MYAACPKRERGTCYICRVMDHRKQLCPQRPITAKVRTSKLANTTTTTHLVQFDTSVIPCYIIEATLNTVGKVNVVLNTGSPLLFLVEALIKSNVAIRSCHDAVQFEGVNRSKINISGRSKQTILVAACEI